MRLANANVTDIIMLIAIILVNVKEYAEGILEKDIDIYRDTENIHNIDGLFIAKSIISSSFVSVFDVNFTKREIKTFLKMKRSKAEIIKVVKGNKINNKLPDICHHLLTGIGFNPISVLTLSFLAFNSASVAEIQHLTRYQTPLSPKSAFSM